MLHHPDAPAQLIAQDEKLQREEPQVNQWVCMFFLVLNIGIMAVTSEWVSVLK